MITRGQTCTGPILPLLAGKRVVVLGSAGGLGLAVAEAAQNIGAEVIGLDDTRRFDHLSALYLANLTDPAALDAAVASLPDGIDALALMSCYGTGGPDQVLARALLAPRHLLQAIAPKLARGAAVVVRGTQPLATRAAHLAEIRAALALNWDDVQGFVSRWGLATEPTRAPHTAGWAMQALAMTKRWAWADRGIRINCIAPAAPDGHLPPQVVADARLDAPVGTIAAAQAALFLMSPMSVGITGATLATDGGLSAHISTTLDGL